MLKQDISLRIAEAANDAKELYRAVQFKSENRMKYLQRFMTSFFSLYDQTKEHLEAEQRQVVEEGGETTINGQTHEIPSVEDWFSDPHEIGQTVEGEPELDVDRMAKQALKLYRVYKELLRQCGILELKKTSHNQRGIGGKD